MLGMMLIAAGMSVAPSPRTHRWMPRSLDQRVALLEAKELLESQQLWHLQAQMPPEAMRALEDLQLHLKQDQEQDERVHQLEAQLQTLQQRLAQIELLVRGALPEGNAILVAPAQEMSAPKKAAKKRKKKPVAAN
jgi:hypothetical protein